jgi:hypothetical protein
VDLAIVATITSLGGGAALIQLLRMFDRHLDRRLLRRVLRDHGQDEVKIIASALSQTRWRPAAPDAADEDATPAAEGDAAPKQVASPELARRLQLLRKWLHPPSL